MVCEAQASFSCTAHPLIAPCCPPIARPPESLITLRDRPRANTGSWEPKPIDPFPRGRVCGTTLPTLRDLMVKSWSNQQEENRERAAEILATLEAEADFIEPMQKSQVLPSQP